jgi:hypothetical protein
MGPSISPFRQIPSFRTDVEGDMAFPSFNHIKHIFDHHRASDPELDVVHFRGPGERHHVALLTDIDRHRASSLEYPHRIVEPRSNPPQKVECSYSAIPAMSGGGAAAGEGALRRLHPIDRDSTMHRTLGLRRRPRLGWLLARRYAPVNAAAHRPGLEGSRLLGGFEAVAIETANPL